MTCFHLYAIIISAKRQIEFSISKKDEKIYYSANLANGTAKVFYDCNGTKTELFSIDSGDEINDISGVLQKGTVYIIVEMSEEANDGKFNFEIK